MQTQTTLFRTRIPQKRLTEASGILEQLGLTPGEAFNALLAQIILRRGLPFILTLEYQESASTLLTAAQQAQVWEETLGEY
ncbi:MAG: type II toxin-antitoxin system RelB/DinJ family antitoxin [Verrucomicrobiales bacterium]|jgi:addiction module RelB/DinJ family antitoxin|nr:type II toxin-antitoxin system RelB/DinJ family antitoxin [Verrucomicrobiales bacterium]